MREHALPTTIPSIAVRGTCSTGEQKLVGLCPIWTAGKVRLPAFVPLEGESLTIGRDEVNGLSLAHDRSASRAHAKLFRRDNRVWLADVGSTNGTWVFGERICAQVLNHYDVIRIGGTLLRFMESDATEGSDGPCSAARNPGALVQEVLKELGRTDLQPSIEFMEAIATRELYSVRELASAVKVATAFSTSKTLSAAHLPITFGKGKAQAVGVIEAEDTRQTMRKRRAPSLRP